MRTNARLPRDTTQIRADNNFYKQNKDKNGVVAGLIIAAVRWQKINYRLTERQSVTQPRSGRKFCIKNIAGRRYF